MNCINLEKEIIDYRRDNESFIRNARLMLAEELENGNDDKVKDITALLIYRYGHRLVEVFHPEELFVIGTETDSLALIFDYVFDISKVRTNYYNCRGGNPFPKFDRLYEASNNLLDEKKIIYTQTILDSSYPEEEKDFILLGLQVRFNCGYYYHDEKLNNDCEIFLAKHPESKYEEFIRDNIRQVYKRSNWGMGTIFLGGYSNCIDKLGEYLDGGFSCQFGGHISYKSFTARALLRSDILHSGKSFNENGAWDNDDVFVQYYYGLQLGYNFFDTKKFSSEPYISIGLSELENEKKSKSKDIIDISNTIGYGVSFKYLIIDSYDNGYNPYAHGSYYLACNLDYSRPDYKIENKSANNGIFSVSLGFGYYIRSDVKDW